MITSETSFYGTESVSPTTEDIRRFSKPLCSKKPEEKRPTSDGTGKNEYESSLVNHSKESKNYAIKVHKGVAFNMERGAAQKSISAKVILRRMCYVLLGLFITIVLLGFATYAGILPIVFASNLAIRRHLMFVGWVRSSPSDLQRPWKLHLPCSTHQEIRTNSGIVAAWYIPPALKEHCNLTKPFEGPNPVILFVPSLEQTRASPARLDMLRTISQNLGYHVLAFDYKGTADSEDILPSVNTVVSDTIDVCVYLQGQMREVQNDLLYVWGDTWGAAIALQAITNPRILNGFPVPKIMVLQTPVESTLKAAGSALSFNQIWRWMPLFKRVFVESLGSHKETNFDSKDAIVGHIPLSDLVLHAEDDDVVSVDQGQNIYNALLEAKNRTGSKVNIRIHVFPASESLGHSILSSPNFLPVIRDFVDGRVRSTISPLENITTSETSTNIA